MNARHLIPAIAAALLLLATACDSSNDTTHHPAPTRSHKAAPKAQETSQAPEYADPTEDDFLVRLKTTQRQCFGSAGCNVTVEPSITYTGLDDLDPDKSYDITYQISGDESGPVIDTMQLTDGDTLHFHPSMISTASSYTDLSIKITDVEETS
jgi:hypothetical protein